MLKRLSRAIFQRDDWKCRHCGNGIGLHPHHVVYRSAGGKDADDNLITLCAWCHRMVHDGHLKVEVVKLKAHNVEVKFWKQKGWKL